jgi:hypothetical protein
MDKNGHFQKTGASPELAEHPQKQTEKNMVTYFGKTVGNSYYDVSQHQKLQFNIRSFKRELNKSR